MDMEQIKGLFLSAVAGAHIVMAGAVPYMPEDSVDALNKMYDSFNGESTSYSEVVDIPDKRESISETLSDRSLDQIDAQFVDPTNKNERFENPVPDDLEMLSEGPSETERDIEDMSRDLEAIDNLWGSVGDLAPESIDHDIGKPPEDDGEYIR